MDKVINIRTKKKVHDDARKIFTKMGLSTSAAINMFLHRVVADKALPFTPSVPKLSEEKNKKETIEKTIPSEKAPESQKEKSKTFFKLWG